MDVIGDIEQQIGKAREALDNKRTELVEQQMTHQSAIKTTFLLYKATVSAIGVG